MTICVCVCVDVKFANSTVPYREVSFSIMARLHALSQKTTKAKSCNCEKEKPGKYSFMQMSISLWFHTAAENARFLNFL